MGNTWGRPKFLPFRKLASKYPSQAHSTSIEVTHHGRQEPSRRRHSQAGPAKARTWGEWGGRHYTQQKESWMPWIEDKYLAWFTKDNKASYATKDSLGKTKVTGVDQVDNLQDGVNNLAAGQVGKGGLLQP